MKHTTKKLLFIGLLALLGATPYVLSHSTPENGAFEGSQEEEGRECTICCDTFDKDDLIIQLDCNQKITHCYHLSCIKDWVVKFNKTTCPICRSAIKVHDPRSTKNSYSHVHHRQKPLSGNEQAALRAFLTSNKVKLNQKPADTILRHCSAVKHSQGCNNKVAAGDIYIQFSCSHGACLDGALALTRGTKNECPTCKKALEIIDPIKRDKRQTTLVYGPHKLTKIELEKINELRTFAHIPVKQNHIKQAERIALKKGAATWKAPKPKGRKPFPKSIIDGLTPEEYTLNMQYEAKKKNSLPISKEKFPLKYVTQDDIRLNNEYLPRHLDPCKWQIIMQKNGTLARALRMYPLSKWPSENGTQAHPKDPKSPFKGKQGDILAGFLFGYLIGPEFRDLHTEEEKKTRDFHRWFYVPAAIGGYGLLKDANPQRTFQPMHAFRWATGIALGAYINYLQYKN